jgi:DNA-binding transcriptional regulator YiaG
VKTAPDLASRAIIDLAREWREKAEQRRLVSRIDPAADALEFCAGEAIARLRSVEITKQQLTVEQFARLAHINVTPQTVRNWIRSGRLAAVDTIKGYRIAADAIVLKPAGPSR